VHGLVKLMDEAMTIRNIKFRIGWDAIIGFFPLSRRCPLGRLCRPSRPCPR
jgi:hypothetical protein